MIHILLHRCSVDKTLRFHPRPDPQTQRFSLEAFQYVRKHPYVFFHCKVKVCNATDPASRCEQGCIKRERRRTNTLPDNIDDVYALAQGPLTLNREKWGTDADDQDLDSNKGTQVLENSMYCWLVRRVEGTFFRLDARRPVLDHKII